jgi:hypothetical protein
MRNQKSQGLGATFTEPGSESRTRQKRRTVFYRRKLPPYINERGRRQGQAVIAVSKAKSD